MISTAIPYALAALGLLVLWQFPHAKPSSTDLRTFLNEAIILRDNKDPNSSTVAYQMAIRLITITDVPFWMALPVAGTGVKAAIVNEAIFEKGDFLDPLETAWVKLVARNACSDGNWMIDVGSNTGFFSLIGLTYGCRTKTVDGARDALHFFKLSVGLNGWDERAEIYDRVVSPEATVNFDGWSALDKTHSSPLLSQSHLKVQPLSQTPITLDALVGESTVAYLKVDAECYEPNVFKSGVNAINSGRVRNLLFEFTYRCVWMDLIDEYERDVFRPLLKAGYECTILGAPHFVYKLETLSATMDKYRTTVMGCPVAAKGCGHNVVCSLDRLQAEKYF